MQRENRDRAAVDLGIAKWRTIRFENGLSAYRTALSAFWLTLESFLDAGRATESAWARLEEAKAREARQQEIATRLERAAAAAQIRYDSLRQIYGAHIDQILQQTRRGAKQRLDDLQKQERKQASPP